MRRVPVLAAACAGVLAAAPRLAAAATFAATTVEQVARASDAVVRGRVAATASRATKDGRIVTDVDLEVDEVWKGAPERTLRLVVPGGRLPGVAMRVDGAPRFEVGEDVIVFAHRRGPGWNVSGLAAGKFHVEAGVARPALAGAAVLPRALPDGELPVGPVPIAELERRVRAAR